MSGNIVMIGPSSAARVTVGDVVRVESGTGHFRYRGNVVRVSPQRKCVTVLRPGSDFKHRFYRDGSSMTYIYEPGTGQWGRAVNDRFTVR